MNIHEGRIFYVTLDMGSFSHWFPEQNNPILSYLKEKTDRSGTSIVKEMFITRHTFCDVDSFRRCWGLQHSSRPEHTSSCHRKGTWMAHLGFCGNAYI